jgi:hypothetical protein
MRRQPVTNPTPPRDNTTKKGQNIHPYRERESNPGLCGSKPLTTQTLLTFRLAKLTGLNGGAHRWFFVKYLYICTVLRWPFHINTKRLHMSLESARGYYCTEPCWISDGSALSRHGLHPFLHPLYFLPSMRLYALIGQLSPDFPPPYACLGRKEQLSLCSLKEYPFGTGRLLASGEPISKFGFNLGFVKILFRPRFIVGWWGEGCPRSQAVGG